MEPNVRSVHPKQALAVYAESMVEAARVAVFGNAAHGLGPRFAELGARTVIVWDPDAIRAVLEANGAADGVTVEAYPPTHSSPKRAVDLAIVPDLGLFDDPADLIARVREMVGEAGIALIAAANRDAAPREEGRAFDYYELFDLVAGEFDDVRMVAEVPFHGVALVRLGDDDDPQTVSVDTQLADGPRVAESFVVVASQRPVSFDPYTIIELAAVSDEATASAELEGARAALSQALAQAEVLEHETQRKVEALRAEVRAHAAGRDRASEQAVELEGLLRDQSTRAAELEAALVERARHLSELSAEVEEKRAAAEAGRIAAAEMEQIARRADRAERRSGELEHEVATLAEAHAQELARFEEGLRERARAVQALEAELARREKMVRELASFVDEASSSSASVAAPPEGVSNQSSGHASDYGLSEENARLREQLNGLALDLARREGEAQAASWSVAELERRLAQAAVAVEPESGALRAALDELDVLRRALAQEHEDRRKAEAGEAVARAEVEKQLLRLEQLAQQQDPQGREVTDLDQADRGADAPNP